MNNNPKKHSFNLDVSGIKNLSVQRGAKRAGNAVRMAAARTGRKMVPLSRGRKIAALIPLFAALVSYVVIPSYADTFGGGVTEPHYTWVYVKVPSGAVFHYTAGLFVMRDLTTNQGGITAYCIDISHELNWNTTFSNGAATSNQIAYILNKYRLNVSDPGALANVSEETAAIQVAIWRFSDGAVAVNSDANVVNRANAIIADASANATAPQPNNITVAFQGAAPVIPASNTQNAVATVKHPDGSPAAGVAVNFTTTNSLLGNGAGTQQVTTDGNGNAVVTVMDNTPGVTINLTASTTSIVPAGLTLNPAAGNSQRLVLASQIPMATSASASTVFQGGSLPKVSKVITDTTTGATGNAKIVAKPGDTLRYDITYANDGVVATNASTVTDNLASGNLNLLQNVAVANGGVENAQHVVTWNVGALAPGAHGTVSFTGVVPSALDAASVDICNAATLTTPGPVPGPGGTTGNGTTGSNQVCATVTTVASVVESKLVDNVTNNTADLGQTLTYTISVKNNGTRNLTNVAVTDVLKGHNLDLLTTVAPKNGATYDAATRTVSYTAASLPVGATDTVTFTAAVPAHLDHGVQTCFVNVATVTGSGGVGGPTNEVKTCVTPAVCTTPTPTITMTGPDTFNVGTQATYTVNVANSGTSGIAGDTVVVTVPTGWTVASTTPQATSSGNTATFNLGVLAPGANQTLTVVANVPNNATTGPANATAVMTGQDSSTTLDCNHPQVNVQANTSGTVLQPPVSQVQAVTVTGNVPVPHTGASLDLYKYGIIGTLILLSGIIVLTGIKKEDLGY